LRGDPDRPDVTAIHTDDLTVRFGDVLALDGLDLSVEEGEIYGFLGPNGAGKSTTINVLLDFVRPTEGRATVLGMDAQADSKAVRAALGVLPEGYGTYGRLTAAQHVAFVADSKGVDADPHGVLQRVGLADAADRRAGGFSKGMGQRLALAMALVGDPEILVLDEPTSGLDPNGAREIRRIVREENERGTTVFFSSHVLGQVEAVCDRAGILQDGRLVAEDTVEGLRDSMTAEGAVVATVEGPVGDAGALRESVGAVEGVSAVTVDGDRVRIACEDRAKFPALAALDRTGRAILDVDVEDASLEDAFARVTGGDGDGDGGARPTAGAAPGTGSGGERG
jgi:ABC-2 type transport system ATP-binding protein